MSRLATAAFAVVIAIAFVGIMAQQYPGCKVSRDFSRSSGLVVQGCLPPLLSRSLLEVHGFAPVPSFDAAD